MTPIVVWGKPKNIPITTGNEINGLIRNESGLFLGLDPAANNQEAACQL